MSYITLLTYRTSVVGSQLANRRIRTSGLLVASAILLIASAQDVRAQQWSTASNGSDIYKTNAAGNVGIGTTTPSALVEINKGQNAGTALVVDNSYTNAGNAAYSGFWFRQGGVNRFFFGSVNDGNTAQAGGPGAMQFWNFANAPMLFSTNNTERARIDAAGNVGIGTTSPLSKLEVAGAVHFGSGAWPSVNISRSDGTAFVGSNTGTGNLVVANMQTGVATDRGGQLILGARATTGSDDLTFARILGGRENAISGNYSTYLQLDTLGSGGALAGGIRLSSSGNVGIGTTNPLSNLQIGSQGSSSTGSPVSLSLGGTFSSSAGANLKLKLYDDGVTSNTYGLGVSSASMDFGVSPSASYNWYAGGASKMTLTNTGNLSVSGNINAKYQDVAEWVESSQHLPAGTVVVLDSTKSNQVTSSTQAYDTRVAGVISELPGIALGESGENKVLVATTGRVRVRVDASKGPIQIGDLLVTSDVPGEAMKSEPVKLAGRLMHMPGTLIGKALEPLEKGSGKILVLLSLQ
jgi:hypothetical protein